MQRHSARLSLVVLVVTTVLAAGCASLKAPTLQVDALKIGDMGITGAALDITFRVRNPNPEKSSVCALSAGNTATTSDHPPTNRSAKTRQTAIPV
jgi:hypothetical protein